MPLITIHDHSLTQVIKIPLTDKNLRLVNNMVMYIFKEEGDAKRFIEILNDYVTKDYKHCRDGQRFWPEFRILTKKAINYDIIQNITPTRKYVLDNAGVDYDFNWFMAKRKRDEEKMKLKHDK